MIVDDGARYEEPLLWRKDPVAVEQLVRAALDGGRALSDEQRVHFEVALAYALAYQRRFDEARRVIDAALARCPGEPQASLCDAQLAFFTDEPWPAPWNKLEARWTAGWADYAPIPRDRLWDGSPLDGRSILLAGEGGLGDQIQFVRFASALKAAGAGRVAVSVHSALMPIVSAQSAVDMVLSTANPPETLREVTGYDVGVPMLSAPRFLCRSPHDLPKPPAIPVPPDAVEAMRRRVAETGARVNVGLCWMSKFDVRSLPLEMFRPLAAVPSVRLFALGEPHSIQAAIAGFPIADLSAPDILATAAAVTALDVIICVDTMIVHLAGALRKPVWLVVHELPAWRWPANGDTTPWYESVRFVRQTSSGWPPVIDRLAADLRALAAGDQPSNRIR